ncbi:Putative Grg1 protein [[Torrubiella] hemipterigena]|uniref:Putative Grg1 protein n=1 Tax=[Torrubiella] hemipterigena TaxID=1531966 RepID=A0A0A1TK74_9HYPO|nr:Putative Grg1 protein [[Torrubiella] hemipterigena]
MESAKQAVNYVAESVQGAISGVSKEANKEVAKDSNASVGTRLTAAKDAVGDAINESGHNAKAEVHKEAAQH